MRTKWKEDFFSLEKPRACTSESTNSTAKCFTSSMNNLSTPACNFRALNRVTWDFSAIWTASTLQRTGSDIYQEDRSTEGPSFDWRMGDFLLNQRLQRGSSGKGDRNRVSIMPRANQFHKSTKPGTLSRRLSVELLLMPNCGDRLTPGTIELVTDRRVRSDLNERARYWLLSITFLTLYFSSVFVLFQKQNNDSEKMRVSRLEIFIFSFRGQSNDLLRENSRQMIRMQIYKRDTINF